MATAMTKEFFEAEVLQADEPVLVDFWADWCGPCRMIAPIVEEVAQEMEGKVKVYKVNIDEEPGLAQEYGVMSIPTLILFKNGAPAGTTVGVVPKEEIITMIENG